MREAYRRVHKDAAAGVDGVTTARYGAELEANLSSLLERFVAGPYRAPTVCRVHLEKPGTSKTRPIGIPTLQDKVLQRAVLMVLESVYERELLECSNGFRPGAVRARATVRPAGGGADCFRRRSDDSTGPNGLVQDAELHLLRFPSAGRTDTRQALEARWRGLTNLGGRAPATRWGIVRGTTVDLEGRREH